MDKLFYAEAALQRKRSNFACQTAKSVSPEQLQQQLQLAAAATAIPVALLQGAKTLGAHADTEVPFLSFLCKTVCDEIAPALDLPIQMWRLFLQQPQTCLPEAVAAMPLETQVPDLLENWGSAVLPVVKQYVSRYQKLPVCLVYSLAACIAVQNNASQATLLLADATLWGEKLTQLAGLEIAVRHYLDQIYSQQPPCLPLDQSANVL